MKIRERIEEKILDIPVKERFDVYCFLHDLYQVSGFDICAGLLEKCKKWNLQMEDASQSFPRLSDSMVGNYVRLYLHRHYFNPTQLDEPDTGLEQIPALDMDKPPAGMGLLYGYAGEGMLRLTALCQTNRSWMHLL